MKFFLIYLITLTLLAINPPKTVKDTPHFRFNSKNLGPQFTLRKNSALYQAFVFGNKKFISKKLRHIYQQMGLLHLMTPSGIHFHFPFLISKKLINAFQIIGVFSNLLFIGLCFWPWTLAGFYSLKRIGALHALHYINTKLNFKLPFNTVFLLYVIFDFWWGTFNHSPLSFTLSFHFLALFILKPKFTSLIPHLIMSQFLIQVILNYTWPQLPSLLIGLGLSSLFTLIFPFLFMNALISFYDFSSPIISIFNTLVIKGFHLGTVLSHSPIVFYFLLLFLLPKKKKSILLAALVTFFLGPHQQINFYDDTRFNRSSPWDSYQKPYSKEKKHKWGYSIEFMDKTKCEMRLHNFGLRGMCKV